MGLADAPKAVSRTLLALWVCSTVFLVLGLMRPAIRISVNVEGVFQEALDQQPAVGFLLHERGLDPKDIASRLPPSNVTRQSIVSSAMKLYRLGSHLAASLILLFSIIIPIIKQTILCFAVMLPAHGLGKLSRVIQFIHKWAMLDVFVLSMAVIALSSASAWSAVLLDGFTWFVCYIFSAGMLGILIGRRCRPPAAPAP